MLKKVFLLSLSLFVLGTFSCKDKEEVASTNTSTGKLSDTDKKKLVDKIWYPTVSSGGVNMEFKTGGIYRINKALDGTWSWSNNGDTMNIVDYGNTKYKLLIVSIGSTQMSFRTNQSGENFKTLFTLRDTE